MKTPRKSKKILAVIFMLLFIFVAACSVSHFTNDAYRSESQFKEYVYEYFSEFDSHRVKQIAVEEELIEYDRPLSIAFRYPNTGMEGPDEHINNIVNTAKEEFYSIYADADRKAKIVRFMAYDAYQPQKEAISILIHQEDELHDGDEVAVQNKKIYTYNYSTETGEALEGINFFKGGFRAYFSQYLTKYFQENHGDELLDGYQNYLTASVNNFKDFIVTDGGVKFYFQPGTVMAPEKGIVSVEVGYQELNGIMREKVDLDAIDPEKPMVALTYDDGPYPVSSNRILDCLEKYGQVATFFELGRNAAAYPDVVKRKAQLGMEIGNHTYSHKDLHKLTPEEVAAEINTSKAAIESAGGKTVTVFRPPYGNTSAVVETTAAMPVILWSVDTLDWKSRDANSVFNEVKKIHDKGSLNGRVILMHSIYDSTAQATEMIVPWLLQNGYQLVTVSELIQYSYGEAPQPKLSGYGYFYK